MGDVCGCGRGCVRERHRESARQERQRESCGVIQWGLEKWCGGGGGKKEEQEAAVELGLF